MSKYQLTDENVTDYRDGKISFDAFARQSRDEWSATAKWLLRRWHVPCCVEERDVIQELLTGAWLAVAKWDPARGTTLRAYVRFGSLHRAMRWIHGQRNAKRRDGKALGRFELSLPSGAAEPGELSLPEVACEADQEHRALLEAGKLWLDPVELEAAEGVLREGSLEAWAWRVLGSQRLRESQGVSNYRAALGRGLEAVAKLAAAV